MKDCKVFVYDKTKKQAVINKLLKLGHSRTTKDYNEIMNCNTELYIYLSKRGFVKCGTLQSYDDFKAYLAEEILLDDFLALEPEKKRVPLTYEDMKIRWASMYPMALEIFGECCSIRVINEDALFTGHSEGWKYDELMKQDIKFVNGDPCWKEV